MKGIKFIILLILSASFYELQRGTPANIIRLPLSVLILVSLNKYKFWQTGRMEDLLMEGPIEDSCFHTSEFSLIYNFNLILSDS